MDENWVERMFDDIDDEHKKMDNEFRRLCAEPTQTVPTVGDRVVVACGFLGMGHLWERSEGLVEEVGDTSVRVRFVEYKPYGEPKGSLVKWVNPNLITDVLKK